MVKPRGGWRVVVAGMDTRSFGPGDIAGAVGTLFQDPETQIVMGSPRAELAFPLENRGEPPGSVARGVEEAALALGIAHLLDRSTSELSGGELQRVAELLRDLVLEQRFDLGLRGGFLGVIAASAEGEKVLQRPLGRIVIKVA